MSTTVEHTCTAMKTSVRWKIENFSTMASRDNPKEVLWSDNFSLFKSRLTFRLRFDPTCTTKQYAGYSSIFLSPVNLDNEESVKLNWKFWIENTDGKKIGNQRGEYAFSSKKLITYRYSDFVHHSELYPPSDFVKDDTVFLCCEIRRDTTQPDFKPFELENKFAESMWILYNEPGSGDECTIQVGKESFKVERCLLTEQSEVFAAMLQLNMKESQTGVIEMKDLKPTTLKGFIRYIYHGYLDEDGAESANELLKFADKYMIKKLKEECVSILKKEINQSNILDRLETAFMYNAEELKRHLIEYLIDDSSEGNWQWLTTTEEWIDFTYENKKLGIEITKAVYAKRPQL